MDNIAPAVHRYLHLLALGSNATPESSSNAALLMQVAASIKDEVVVTLRMSRIYLTPAFPAGSGPDYANACIAVESSHSPQQMLAIAHRIEADMGRERKERWGQRVIDIDLLATDQQVLPDSETLREWMDLPLERQMREAPEQLILPHPRMHERGFVLVPLADVAPDWVHPLTGQSVQAMLQGLDPAEIAEIRPI